jgi:hypothetical protein
MPPTRRVSPALGRYLVAHPDAILRRRIEILRAMPLPPGSRPLAADAEWHALAARFRARPVYLYGTSQRGLVYTYDAKTDTLRVELALVDGQVLP